MFSSIVENDLFVLSLHCEITLYYTCTPRGVCGEDGVDTERSGVGGLVRDDNSENLRESIREDQHLRL